MTLLIVDSSYQKLEASYGSFSIGRGKTALAHRVAYEISCGEIPEDLYVLHKCDNRRCVNPNHLYLGTHAENMRDMRERERCVSGEKNGNAKLTRKDVQQIRWLYSTRKYTYRQLAEIFQVSSGYIGGIVREEYWKLPLAE